ncbi:MAG: SBBP repeat-containing protein [Acidobacteriota bacterium]|nr:MAG: SBBP repeat-containing protein [Acidobacteriota bacterium]
MHFYRILALVFLLAVVLTRPAGLDSVPEAGGRRSEGWPEVALKSLKSSNAAGGKREASVSGTDLLAGLPMVFEENGGRFIARGAGYRVLLTPNETILALRDRSSGVASELRIGLRGGVSDPLLDPVDEQPGRINYLIGDDPATWRRGLRGYGGVIYRQVYPGIDVHFYGNQLRLEYDFLVAAGADPGRIRMVFRQARSLRLDGTGDLLLTLAGGGMLRQHKPVIYQMENGRKRSVAGRYVIGEKNEVAFAIDEYDRSLELVIDPVLSYASYLGGGNDDQAAGVAVGSDGDIYVTGTTAATDGASGIDGFPAVGALQASNAGFNDIFVTRFRPGASGTASVVYSTFLGGADDDRASSIALDAAGNIHIAGQTNSTDLPIVKGAQKAFGSSAVFRLAAGAWVPSGSGLSANEINALIVRADEGNAVYAATANNGIYKSTNGGNTWTAANGTTGGDALSRDVRALAVAGGVLLAGTSRGVFRSSDGGATWLGPGFEIAQDEASQERITAGENVRALAVNPADSSVIFIGTSRGVFKSVDGGIKSAPGSSGLPGFDAATGLSTTEVRALLITSSNPLTVVAGTSNGVFQDAGGSWVAKNSGLGNTDVRALASAGTGTMLAATAGGIFRSADSGGTWSKVADGSFLALTTVAGAVYAATIDSVLKSEDQGLTWAPANDGQTSVGLRALAAGADGAVYLGARGASDGFMIRLAKDGAAISYSTYLGGGAEDQANAVAADSSGGVYLTGVTSSPNFPLKGATGSVEGGSDAFVVRLNAAVADADSLVFSGLLGGAGSDQGNGIALDGEGSILVAGSSSSSAFRGSTGVNGFQPTNGNTAVFRSEDSAANWNRFGDGLSGDQADCLAVDPKTPTTIYAGNVNGLFKRTAGDAAWVRKTGAPGNVRAIVIDPADSKIIYLGSEGGIFRSDDGGDSWRSASSGLFSRSVQALAIDGAKTLYAGMSFGGVYKSVDGGSNWQPSNGPAVANCGNCLPATTSGGRSTAHVKSLAVVSGAPGKPAVIHAGLNGGVYRSSDGGSTWAALNGEAGAGNECQTCLPETDAETGRSAAQVDVIVVDPKNAAVIYAAVNGAGLFRTGDGGRKWSASNSGLPNTDAQTGRTTSLIRAVVIDPKATGVLYLGGSGGVFRSGDGAATWQPRNKALTSSRIGALAIDPTDGKRVYAGSASESGDAFLARLRQPSTGAPALDYFTFLGGGDGDVANGLAVTPAGEALVAGQTTSFNFPVTANALQKDQAGRGDAFLVSLDPRRTGAESLRYSTYHGGGRGIDIATSVAVDGQGNIFLAGLTESGDFPVSRAINAVIGGSSDAFVSVLNPQGGDLIYSTFLGGSGRDAASGAAIAGGGTVVVAGTTSSVDFPVSLEPFDGAIGMRPVRPNPFDPRTEMRPGGSDAFVALISGADAAADLAISMRSSGTFRVGEVVRYELTVTNAQGGSTAAAPLRVIDRLHESLEFVSASGSGWTCSRAAEVVTCLNRNPLVAGATATLSLDLRIERAPDGNQLTNTASVYSLTSDPKPENNTASLTTSSIASPCPFTVTPSSLSFGDEAGNGSVSIQTDGGCGWTATTDASFITLLKTGGSGPGTLQFTVAANTTRNTRTGSITVAGLRVTVVQSGVSCDPRLTPPAQSFDSAGGSGSIAVDLPGDCEWTAVSDNPAILTVTAGATGKGSGRVEFTVAPNELLTDRIGTLTISGRQFPVTQKGVVCSYAISRQGQAFGFDGGSGEITVTSPKPCTWQVSNANPNFITIKPDGLVNDGGTGNGVVKFEVLKNEIALRRSGRILIAGLEFTVIQDAFGCSFTLDPATGRSFDAKGGDGTVLVTASQDVCQWSVTGADFVEVLSDQDQTGTAHALFRVEPNRTAASRKTSISIAGREIEINQAAPSSRLAACTYALTLPPAGQTFGVAGGSASILVKAPPGCDWRATVDNASMISFEGNDGGSGNGLIDFTISVNPAGSARVGVITIAGQTLIIRQDGALAGAPCRFIVTPGKISFDAGGGDGSVIVTASQTICEWSAASNADFLRIRNDARIDQPNRLGSLDQTATAYIVFELTPNNRSEARTATLTIAGQRVTIQQSGRPGALRPGRRAGRRP